MTCVTEDSAGEPSRGRSAAAGSTAAPTLKGTKRGGGHLEPRIPQWKRVCVTEDAHLLPETSPEAERGRRTTLTCPCLPSSSPCPVSPVGHTEPEASGHGRQGNTAFQTSPSASQRRAGGEQRKAGHTGPELHTGQELLAERITLKRGTLSRFFFPES